MTHKNQKALTFVKVSTLINSIENNKGFTSIINIHYDSAVDIINFALICEIITIDENDFFTGNCRSSICQSH